MRRLMTLVRIVGIAAVVGMSGCAVDFGVESGEGDEVVDEPLYDEADPVDPATYSGEEAEGVVEKADDPNDGASSSPGASTGSVEDVPACAGKADRALCPLAPKSGTMSHGDPIPWKESDNK